MITISSKAEKPEYEWSSHDKKEIQVNTLSDRHATEMTVGYAPKEETAKCLQEQIPSTMLNMKISSMLHKEDYDPERNYKEKRELKK